MMPWLKAKAWRTVPFIRMAGSLSTAKLWQLTPRPFSVIRATQARHTAARRLADIRSTSLRLRTALSTISLTLSSGSMKTASLSQPLSRIAVTQSGVMQPGNRKISKSVILPAKKSSPSKRLNSIAANIPKISTIVKKSRSATWLASKS